MAQMKNAKGDKAGAIAALEKAVELDPNNAQAKAQLENLKFQPDEHHQASVRSYQPLTTETSGIG
jgi:lipopolysaccharide biosynthesis regulator YciM